MSRQQTPNRDIAADSARANLLVNGGFRVRQRGVTFTTPANLSYTADRWQVTDVGASAFPVINIVDVAAIGGGASNVSGIAASTYTYAAVQSGFTQTIRFSDGNLFNLRGRPISFAATLFSNTPGVLNLWVTSDGTGALNSVNPYTGGGAWQRVALANLLVPVDATFITVGLNFTGSCSWGMGEAMLVPGSVPADYAPLHPADDLARCQRYYEILVNGPEYSAIGQAFTTTAIMMPIRFKVTKAVVPTIALSAAVNFALFTASGGQIACNTATSSGTTVNSTRLDLTIASGSLVGGNAVCMLPGGSGLITAEANP